MPEKNTHRHTASAHVTDACTAPLRQCSTRDERRDHRRHHHGSRLRHPSRSAGSRRLPQAADPARPPLGRKEPHAMPRSCGTRDALRAGASFMTGADEIKRPARMTARRQGSEEIGGTAPRKTSQEIGAARDVVAHAWRSRPRSWPGHVSPWNMNADGTRMRCQTHRTGRRADDEATLPGTPLAESEVIVRSRIDFSLCPQPAWRRERLAKGDAHGPRRRAAPAGPAVPLRDRAVHPVRHARNHLVVRRRVHPPAGSRPILRR